MKPLFIAVLAVLLSGCAENTPSAATVREHFERGLSGQGRLVPLDHPEDAIPPPADQPRPH
jgi:hypothetical protein